MTGCFEKGIWIEAPKPPIEPMIMRVKIDVDDSGIRKLKTAAEKAYALLTPGTEMRICLNSFCDNWWRHTAGKNPGFCNCKAIEIDKDGKCMNFRQWKPTGEIREDLQP